MISLPDQAARDAALEPHSCIVQAPAGSGKTTLLATRYITLLGIVNKPQEILAITFTKKAAAEMKSRVLQMLLEDSPASRAARDRNDALGWNIFTNPNVLKIQTIDSFAMDLASQSHDSHSLSGMDIVEQAQQFYAVAAQRVLQQLIDEEATAPLIADFLATLDNDAQSATRLITTMLARRDQWLSVTREIASNLDVAHVQLVKLMGASLERLTTDAEQALDQLMDTVDLDYFRQFAVDPERPLSGAQALMTKTGTLRRRVTRKDGVGDAAQVRDINRWLGSLHERNLATGIERYAQMPQSLSTEEVADLTRAAVVLTLAAGELGAVFTESNTIDFAELLIAARAALRDGENQPTDLALVLDYRIRHLLIDEYQDTSRSQYEFFELLCDTWQEEEGHTVFAVGDPMQSIYRFRDADVSIFTETLNTGIQSILMNGLNLSANFRSSPGIVDWCNEVFADLFRNGIAYTPAVAMQEEDQSEVSCLRFSDDYAEAHIIVSRIREILQKEPAADVAILCRARTHLTAILEALRSANIPWQAADIDPLSTLPVVVDLHATLKALLDPSDRLGWFSVLRSPLIGFTLADLDSLPGGGSVVDGLRKMDDARAVRILHAYDWARPKLYQRSIREVLEGFWLRMGGADAYPGANWTEARSYLELLEPYGRGMVDIEAVARALTGLYAPAHDQANLKIMTIHKSKGLEFDHVFVPALNHRTRSDDPELISIDSSPAGLLMGTRGQPVHNWITYENRNKAREEEKRLLYVACTRARRSLTLTWAQEAETNVSGLAQYLELYVVDHDALQTNSRLLIDKPGTERLQADLFNAHILHRLPPDYTWTPPAQIIPSLPTHTLDQLGARTEVAVGTLVHQALSWASGNDRGEKMSGQLPDLLEYWMEDLSLSVDVASTVYQRAFDQISNFVQTELGRWCLKSHEQQVAEFALTGIVDGEIRRIVIDRMFVEDGYRWILDYKSSQIESSQGHSDLISRYRPQLETYATICAAMYPEELRKALVLTDTGELIEIT